MGVSLESLVERATAVLKVAAAREIYVFGSFASRRMQPDSDVDIAVSALRSEIFFRAMSDAERALGRSLDLIHLDEDSPFIRYLKSEGELRRVG